MRIADMRLITGVERVPLGDEVERYISHDQHAKAAWQRAAVVDPGVDRVDPRPRPGRLVASPLANHRLVLDEQKNGDVIITRPDGQRVHVYCRAIEATIRKADDQ